MDRPQADPGWAAHEAEQRRVRAAEDAIRAAAPGIAIDFEAARERELEKVTTTEPSALWIEGQRRQALRA